MPSSRSSGSRLLREALSNTARPPISIDPCSGVSSPAIERSIVVLPQPLGPSRAERVSFADLERDAIDRGQIAEALAQVANLDEGIHGVPAAALFSFAPAIPA